MIIKIPNPFFPDKEILDMSLHEFLIDKDFKDYAVVQNSQLLECIEEYNSSVDCVIIPILKGISPEIGQMSSIALSLATVAAMTANPASAFIIGITGSVAQTALGFMIKPPAIDSDDNEAFFDALSTKQRKNEIIPVCYGGGLLPGNIITASQEYNSKRNYISLKLGLCEGAMLEPYKIYIDNKNIADITTKTYPDKTPVNKAYFSSGLNNELYNLGVYKYGTTEPEITYSKGFGNSIPNGYSKINLGDVIDGIDKNNFTIKFNFPQGLFKSGKEISKSMFGVILEYTVDGENTTSFYKFHFVEGAYKTNLYDWSVEDSTVRYLYDGNFKYYSKVNDRGIGDSYDSNLPEFTYVAFLNTSNIGSEFTFINEVPSSNITYYYDYQSYIERKELNIDFLNFGSLALDYPEIVDYIKLMTKDNLSENNIYSIKANDYKSSFLSLIFNNLNIDVSKPIYLHILWEDPESTATNINIIDPIAWATTYVQDPNDSGGG